MAERLQHAAAAAAANLRPLVALLRILLCLLQAVVAVAFTTLVVTQAGLAGCLRLLLGEPAALRKVEAARAAALERTQRTHASAGGPTGREGSFSGAAGCRRRGSGAAASQEDDTAPRHVFNEPQQGHDSEAWRLVGPYMRQYGRHAIANSQLFNPEFIHFFVPGMGSLPYIIADVYNRVVVVGVGEPLAHTSQWRRMTELFVAEFPEAYFYHLTEQYAEVLHDMGYWVNDAGSETTLQVQSWTYSAKTRTVRSAARAARDAGVRVRELAPHELTPEMRRKLQFEVSSDWLQQKAVADRELRVFVRNVDYEHMELRDGVRVFVAEAYPDPAAAPPAVVDPVLQGSALNAKPPKPPRRKSSGALSRSSSRLTACSSCDSLVATASLAGEDSTQTLQGPGLLSWLLRGSNAAADAGSGSGGGGSDGTLTANSSSSSSGCASGSSNSSSPRAAADRFDAAVEIVQLEAGDAGPAKGAADAAAAAATDVQNPRKKKVRLAAPPTAAELDGAALDAAPDVPAGGARDQARRGPRADEADGPLLPPSPFEALVAAAGGAGRGQQQQQQQQQQPELAGFVLLDPMWEGGRAVGYVSSLMRMTRTAHAGTLKLLYEDIISALRKEGAAHLAFGFSPLFNMRDAKGWRYLHWMRWTALYIFNCANNVYAFKNLAFSKSRYGAGLTPCGTAFRDPNVSMSQIYMAARHYAPGWTVVDLYGFFEHVGLIDRPLGTLLKMAGLKRGGANRGK